MRVCHVTKEDIKHLEYLSTQIKGIRESLKNITPSTPKEEKESMEDELAYVLKEGDEIVSRIICQSAEINHLRSKISEVKDGADLKGFDEDMKMFFDSLYNYYDGCKERLDRMCEQLYSVKIRRLSLILRFERWMVKRRIQKERKRYDMLQRGVREDKS